MLPSTTFASGWAGWTALQNMTNWNLLVSGASQSLNSTGITVKDATQRIGIRFQVPATTTIASGAFFYDITGTMTGITSQMHIETHMGSTTNIYGQPSGVTVGSGTSAYAVPSADGFTAVQNFGADTTLYPNTPYWLVIEDGGGTAPTGSKFYGASTLSGTTGRTSGSAAVEQHTGVSWGSLVYGGGDASYYLVDTNGKMYGYPYNTSGVSNNATARVGGTNRVGLRFKVGGNALLSGVSAMVTKQNVNLGNLEFNLYQGNQLMWSRVIASSSIVSSRLNYVTLDNPVILSPNATYTLYLHQENDGGNTTTLYYGVTSHGFIAGTEDAFEIENWGFYNGTSADPTTFTYNSTLSIGIIPLIKNITTDFRQQRAYAY